MGFIGFFVRDTLGQLPDQTGSCWSSSPDIMINPPTNYPDSPLADYASATGYATDYGQTVNMGDPNYIYLRALNTNTAATPTNPIQGRIWFYFTESDLALWPQNWRGWNGDCMTVAGNPVNYQAISATGTSTPANPGVVGNPVCVANLPFIWTPPPFSPNAPAGTHYCLVSWVEYPAAVTPSDPTQNFGSMGSFEDLVNFVLDNPNMGWRNTTDVSGAGNTWSRTTNITGPAQPGYFNIGIQCTNMPTDGQVGFTMPAPGPVGSGTSLPMTPISQPNFESSVRITDWPGGAMSSVVVTYQQGATAPPQGANISVTLTTPQASVAPATFSRVVREAPNMLRRHTLHANDAFGEMTVQVGLSPTVVIQVDAQNYNF